MTTKFEDLGASADSAANNDDDGISAPHPVTGRYLSMQALLGLVKDAIGAHPNISMSDTDMPPVEWARAIEDATYKADGCLGELQGDVDYTVDDYEDTYGDSITTPHGDLTSDEREQLAGLFGDSENHVRKDASGTFKLPVVNGDRLPVLVADEDVLSEALDMLDDLMEEARNSERSTADGVDDDDDDDETCGAATGSGEPCERSTDGGRCWQHDGEEVEEVEGGEGDDEGGDEAGSTTDGIDTEKLAETVATAVVEALNN